MKISLRDKIISPWNVKIQNFLMWFKNGLKAQKLLAQGSALGIITFSARRPSGRQVCDNKKPRAMPWARSFCPFRAYGEN